MDNKISELDIVEVIASNHSVPEAIIGDQGTALLVFGDVSSPEAYEVECILKDGSTKWQGTFLPSQLELVIKCF